MVQEKAVIFGESTDLVGVVSPSPDNTRKSRRPGVILLNAGLVHRIGPHRMSVRLARDMAGAGFTSLRFDFSGVGDSPRRRDHIALRKARELEIDSAMNFLERRHGIDRFVLSGLCTGADEAFRAAVRDERVIGVILIDAFPLRTFGWYRRHFGRRLFRWRSWKTLLSGPQLLGRAFADGAPDRDPPSRQESRAGLRSLIERRTGVLCLYTSGMEDFYNDPRQFGEIFRGLDLQEAVDLRHLSEADHIFSDRGSRMKLAAEVCTWLSCRFGSAGVEAENGVGTGCGVTMGVTG